MVVSTHRAKDRMTSWTRIDTDTDLDSQSWDLGFEADWNDTALTDEGTGTTQTRTHNAAHELLAIAPDSTDPLPAFSQGQAWAVGRGWGAAASGVSEYVMGCRGRGGAGLRGG